MDAASWLAASLAVIAADSLEPPALRHDIYALGGAVRPLGPTDRAVLCGEVGLLLDVRAAFDTSNVPQEQGIFQSDAVPEIVATLERPLPACFRVSPASVAASKYARSLSLNWTAAS